jgi:hypothetical protein
MPKPTTMGPRWVLAPAAALVAAVVWCAPAGAIVGGTQVSIEDHPYQVALVNADKAAADPAGQYCGGSVRDTLHVITAAHCVFNTDGSGQRLDPSQVDILAGVADLRDEAQGQRLHVSAISFEPDYNASNFSYDAAVLTLAEPLEPDTAVQPTQIIDATTWQTEPTGTDLFVTGWGSLHYGDPPQYTLHGAQVDYYTKDDCENDPDFFVQLAPGQMCATAKGTRDACQGDSGGPLVLPFSSTTPADDRLVGIVSSGVGCADRHFPGIYTEAAYPAIKSFLEQANPPPAPTNRSAPALSGVAAIGQQLTCSPGSWSGSPSLSYQFVRSVDSVDVAVATTSPTYTVTDQDVGATLRCEVTATNSGGTAVASSAAAGPVAGVTQPTPPTPQPPQPSLDLYAPVARITSVRCTATRCTLAVRVSDVGFSAGIKTVQASVRSTYRSSCKRGDRKVACTKHKTGRPTVKALSATRFQVVASKLPVGRQLFTVVAVDRAGHRQSLPTRKTVTTKRRKRR